MVVLDIENYSNILKNISEMKKNDFFLEDKINIFTLISDQYKKENLHSDILRCILDPSKQQNSFGNCKILKLFFDFIGLSKEEKKYFLDASTIKVKREQYRIDILIHNDKYAIMIESKINDAPDQKNQLIRYYKELEEEGFDVIRIIYISRLYNRRPNFLSYSSEYLKLFHDKKIEEKIVYMSASSGEKNLIQFISKCLKHIWCLGKTKTTILEHYKDLLRYIGEIDQVTQNEKGIMKYILSKNKIRDVERLVSIWDKRGIIMFEVLKNALVGKNGYTYEKILGYAVISKKSKTNETLSIYLYPCGRHLQIGFCNKSGFSDTKLIIDKLESLRSEIKNPSEIYNETQWIYFNFLIEDLQTKKLDFDAIENYIQTRFDAVLD